MTTREPDASIAEVAITAFNAMIEQEQILAAQAKEAEAPAIQGATTIS